MSARVYPNAADLTTAGQPSTLPADFDAMLRAAPSLTGSSDMRWMRHEGSVNDGEDLRAEEDGEL